MGSGEMRSPMITFKTYAEYIIVPDLQFLVKLPDSIPLSVAAMLPTGALLAMNTVSSVHQHVSNILKVKDTCKILIVGTGGLALWALRIAGHHFINIKNRISITVASLKDEGFTLAKECEKVNVVQWNEDVYEKQLIERTIDACKGKVNIVIDFGTTSRSLHRSLQCLSKGGVVFISSEVAEKLLPKFSRRAEERQQTMKPVDMGSIEQLRQLVDIVGKGEVGAHFGRQRPGQLQDLSKIMLYLGQIRARTVLDKTRCPRIN
uniref:Alcohol dehydrogenase-like C-terminal domain-containing protein n=1 Tax=Timema bartmani TaxID=61472 RepID=A0A7R9FAU1_9NEOP|nr:unnamed protein product [Timema bartmani]